MSKLAALDNKPNLHVYKASAGSGKTHRLTAEYLCLLFSNPFAYKHILTVTFTNKATDEMKSRIIDELVNLATNCSSHYIILLSTTYTLSEAQVRMQARDILVRILHDYSAFSVSTIDKFFQQTMRAFSREIGLGGGYNVELDTDSVLGQAIDSMLFDLERSENKQLLDWLIRFSEEKVENGETWNIRSDIHSLSTEIFKESYKAYSEQVRADIDNKELIGQYKDMLHATIRSFEQTSRNIGEKALNITLQSGLTLDDFKGVSRSPFKAFLKWANGSFDEPTATFRKLENDVSNWYTGKTDGNIRTKIDEVYTELNECVVAIIRHYDNSNTYQTAYEINRYFFTLGILGDVDKKIREYTSENNIMLISDTTELLSRIIEGNDSPFIYEKVGTRINNYMIDEFQDTSSMQWNNFLPLLRDSLAQGNKNFIVGDIKQSIYRWRNSDWKLLDEQLDSDFAMEGIDHETLNMNWRSDGNIVDFNNAIFTQGAAILQETYNSVLPSQTNDNRILPLYSRITKAYGELYQHVPNDEKKGEGYVKVEFVDTKENSWTEYVLKQLPYQIEELQDRGYSLKDIAILVRTKREGAEVANRLLEYKSKNLGSTYRYDVISDEALFVNNAKSIRLILALLKFLQNPLDASLKTLAIYEYFKFNNQLNAESALQKYFSADNELPKAIVDELNRISKLPLYEMTEEIFELFRNAMENDEQIYIQSFLDMVLDFTTRKSSDLDSFLIWWDETGIKKTISTPDGQDAIRIMTIHKSKGLGFDVVILPFCNWDIDHKMPTILWCSPRVDPFDKLHLVPVKYSQKLKNTIFDYEYYNERLHAFIDNLNILYVAFTRAKNALIAYAPKPGKADVNNVSSLLWACINSREENHNLIDLWQHLNDEATVWELKGNGKLARTKKIATTKEIDMNMLPSIAYDQRLKLLLPNKYYFGDYGQRDYGILMHEVLSTISTLDDIEDAVQKHCIAGNIIEGQKNEVINQLRKYLSEPTIRSWYKGGYTVLNEIAILQPNGTIIRPDRVMIKNREAIVVDYKFGEKESNKHIRQVQYYVKQIASMGYNNVEGYICYLKLGKITKVV